MIRFRQKEFGVSDVLKAVSAGAATGGALFAAGGKSSLYNKFRAARGKEIMKNSLALTGTGMLVGGALGLVVGLAKEADRAINRKTTVDDRFLKGLVMDLKHRGYTEGVQFTRDKNKANKMKTKVCLVISKDSGELNLIINTVADKKLRDLTNEVVNNIQNASVVNQKASDRYNEITISTIMEGAEVGLLSGIVERFIHAGYSVYLVEVG